MDLAPGDDLTIEVEIRDGECECYDWGCGCADWSDLLEGTKTIQWDDLATGDCVLSLYDPPGPYLASGWVTLHLDVVDLPPGRI